MTAWSSFFFLIIPPTKNSKNREGKTKPQTKPCNIVACTTSSLHSCLSQNYQETLQIIPHI
jgi:hypothetical protein